MASATGRSDLGAVSLPQFVVGLSETLELRANLEQARVADMGEERLRKTTTQGGTRSTTQASNVSLDREDLVGRSEDKG